MLTWMISDKKDSTGARDLPSNVNLGPAPRLHDNDRGGPSLRPLFPARRNGGGRLDHVKRKPVVCEHGSRRRALIAGVDQSQHSRRAAKLLQVRLDIIYSRVGGEADEEDTGFDKDKETALIGLERSGFC